MVVREAAQQGIIDDPQAWIRYIDARNLTSHTYNEEVAQKVFKTVQEFFPALENLLKKLELL
jgi:nucleotidyltransferase substrate binding protein (TIGR01987 family)